MLFASKDTEQIKQEEIALCNDWKRSCSPVMPKFIMEGKRNTVQGNGSYKRLESTCTDTDADTDTDMDAS